MLETEEEVLENKAVLEEGDIETRIPTNSDMRFEVSTLCNYKCIICPHHKLIRKKEIMSLDMFKYLFDKINEETDQYTTITFPGMGEPTLDKTLLDKIAYVKSRKLDMEVTFITNASFLTPERWMHLEDLGVTSVRISFYGNDAESYAEVMGIRNKNAFEKVCNNLIEISKIKKKTKLLLTMNIINNEYNIVPEEWIKFWEEKADLIEVWAPHNWVDSVKFRKVQEKQMKTCGRPFDGPLQVQVDGTVNMCCFDYDGHLTLGDLKTQSLQEIFSSPLFKKIVQCHTSGEFKESGLICENCDQRNLDKSDVMVYNSKFDIAERVKQLSTTYVKVHK